MPPIFAKASIKLRPGRRLLRGTTVLAFTCLAATGCSSGGVHEAGTVRSTSTATTASAKIGSLTVTGGYIPEPAAPDVAAAYFTVTNRGSTADRVTKLSTDVTTDVQAMTETNSGTVGTMTNLPTLVVPAHGSIKLTPDHAHLMLQNPTRHLKTGDRVSLSITFAHAGTVTLNLPVDPITGPTSASTGMAGMPGMG